jgi:hypothetical protein
MSFGCNEGRHRGPEAVDLLGRDPVTACEPAKVVAPACLSELTKQRHELEGPVHRLVVRIGRAHPARHVATVRQDGYQPGGVQTLRLFAREDYVYDRAGWHRL